MIKFIATARARDVAGGGNALAFYAGPILAWDIAFALAFAAFVVAADVLIAELLARWPWAAYIFLICACMGLLYGAVDVAEDLTLRKIFRHAKSLEEKRRTGYVPQAASAEEVAEKQAALEGAQLADAAQTDAANALTRLKMATLGLSAIGGPVFLWIFSPIASIVNTAIYGREKEKQTA
jgi:MFS family permease